MTREPGAASEGDAGVRARLRRLDRWLEGWPGVLVAPLLAVAVVLPVGHLFEDGPSWWVALGVGLGTLGSGLLRLAFPRRPRAPAWPTHSPPPQRPD